MLKHKVMLLLLMLSTAAYLSSAMVQAASADARRAVRGLKIAASLKSGFEIWKLSRRLDKGYNPNHCLHMIHNYYSHNMTRPFGRVERKHLFTVIDDCWTKLQNNEEGKQKFKSKLFALMLRHERLEENVFYILERLSRQSAMLYIELAQEFLLNPDVTPILTIKLGRLVDRLWTEIFNKLEAIEQVHFRVKFIQNTFAELLLKKNFYALEKIVPYLRKDDFTLEDHFLNSSSPFYYRHLVPLLPDMGRFIWQNYNTDRATDSKTEFRDCVWLAMTDSAKVIGYPTINEILTLYATLVDSKPSEQPLEMRELRQCVAFAKKLGFEESHSADVRILSESVEIQLRTEAIKHMAKHLPQEKLAEQNLIKRFTLYVPSTGREETAEHEETESLEEQDPPDCHLCRDDCGTFYVCRNCAVGDVKNARDKLTCETCFKKWYTTYRENPKVQCTTCKQHVLIPEELEEDPQYPLKKAVLIERLRDKYEVAEKAFRTQFPNAIACPNKKVCKCWLIPNGQQILDLDQSQAQKDLDSVYHCPICEEHFIVRNRSLDPVKDVRLCR